MIVAAAVILSLAGSRNLLEQLISIWSDDYVANFPIIPVTALLIGGGLICVGLLIVAEPLLPKRPPRGRRDP